MRTILPALLISLVLGTTAWGDPIIGPPGSPYGPLSQKFTISELSQGEVALPIPNDLGMQVWSGDVYITEAGSTNTLSDVLRFPNDCSVLNDDHTKTIGYTTSTAILLSDPDSTPNWRLTDWVRPASWAGWEYDLNQQGWEGVVYTARNGDFTNTYTIISDVPEPATLLLFGSALSLIATRLRRRRA